MPFVNKTRAMNHLAGDLSGPDPGSSSLRYQAEAGREMSVDHPTDSVSTIRKNMRSLRLQKI